MFQVVPVSSLASSCVAGSLAATAGTLFLTLAGAEDSPPFVAHLSRHLGESGTAGMPRFAFPVAIHREEMEKAFMERWARPVDQPKWGRAWLLWNPSDTLVIGHLELRGAKAAHSLHRAELSMGLLQDYTQQGLGPVLVAHMLEWCRSQPSLQWLDLGVFSDNEPARKLYRRLGFEEIGHRRAAFRFEDGASVDALYMTKRLR